MARITVNPRFRWSESRQRFVLAGHDGQYEIPDNEITMRADRGVQSSAKGLVKQNQANANTSSDRSTGEYNTLIPGLEADATHPTGFTPLEKSSMVTSTGEALGGANSALTGEAKLASMRTRNASGFAPALAEASREKGRLAATNALQINMADAALAREKQDRARSQLEQLYGIDTGNMLKSMGLEDQALNTQLEGGKSGWQQNAMGWINSAANLRRAFSGGGGGGGGN